MIRSVPPPVRKVIKKIVMTPVPDYGDGFTPLIEILDANAFPHRPMYTVDPLLTFHKFEREISIDLDCAVEGDIVFRVFNRVKAFTHSATVFVFRLAFNTFFVQNGLLTLGKKDLDSLTSGALLSDRFYCNFMVQVVFSDFTQRSLEQPIQQQIQQSFQQPNVVPYQVTGAQQPQQGQWSQPTFIQHHAPYPQVPQQYHGVPMQQQGYQKQSIQPQPQSQMQQTQVPITYQTRGQGPINGAPDAVSQSPRSHTQTQDVSTQSATSSVTGMPQTVAPTYANVPQMSAQTSNIPVGTSTNAPIITPAVNLNQATNAVDEATKRLVAASMSAKPPSTNFQGPSDLGQG